MRLAAKTEAISDFDNPHVLPAEVITNNFKPRAHILLVEDYDANILYMKTLLQMLGYSYDVAVNGAEAVQYGIRGIYNIILMDVGMPIMNGLEATKNIREYEVYNNSTKVPIIGLTAHAFIDDMGKCISAGMDDYLSKPFSSYDFETKLQSWTQKQLLQTG